MVPETRYARSADGSQIAYQVVGEGAIDVLVASATPIPVDMLWDEPRAVQFLERLSSFARHIWFDFRGTGGSDGIAAADEGLLESLVDDMIAVADDAGCERVVVLQLIGSGFGPLFAATHPDRTAALVLVDAAARGRWAEDYPDGLTDEAWDWVLGSDTLFSFETMAPSCADDAMFRSWYERAMRLGAPPDVRRRRALAVSNSDVRGVLGSVQASTLVVTHKTLIGAHGRYLATHIPEAQFVEIEGPDRLVFANPGPILDVIEDFLTGHHAVPEPDRVLSTVLFTDLVSSTSQAAEMGDRRWRTVLGTHDTLVRTQLERFRGRAIKSTGDGVLATFDGPGRAIRCAFAIRESLASLGLEVRAGVHTGEIEVRQDDIAGIAVHIAARVAANAQAGQVLVTRTVTDLVAGSDINFDDQGDYDLKGVSGNWQLFAAHA
jgi:class 3 adenylate cyclase